MQRQINIYDNIIKINITLKERLKSNKDEKNYIKKDIDQIQNE